MGKNVLLLCMSPYQTEEDKEREQEYCYQYQGQEHYLTGKMTNEAPTKYIIETLKMEKQHLDKIVLICSDKIMNEKCVGGKTHIQRFKDTIQKFNEDVNGASGHNIVFDEIRISNNTQSSDIAEAAVKAAEKVESVRIKKEPINLYIDYNGGQRYLAFMIINTAHLMADRKVKLKGVTNMNYDNKIEKNGKEYTLIQNLDEIFQIDALVSGIKEYIHYGRVQELKKYFENCHDDTINSILLEMEKFVEELQMCRTNAVKRQRTVLKEKLEAYLQEMEHTPPTSTFPVLFTYVVHDIMNGYKKMFDGDIPEIILWCVKKGFIQQAVTFYAEQIPIYFYDKGILKPSQKGEEEYNQEYQRMREAYEWKSNSRKWHDKYPSYDQKSEGKNFCKYYKDFDKKYCFLICWLQPYSKKKKSFIQSKKQYWDSSVEEKLLKKMLEDYYMIKEIRNSANHASDQNNKTIAEIERIIQQAIDRM